ncbi:MAG: FmdB family zinc ribbon protein [bacterium]
MPTYRYECARCGRIHEYFHGMSEPPKTRCPDCGGRLTQLIGGGSGVILKGTGFHKTDYRSKSSREAAHRDETAAKSESTPKPKETKDKKESKGGGEGAKG